MTADEDEDALGWEGDRDPTLYGSRAAKPASRARAATVPDATESVAPAGLASSAFLVTIGVLAGIYLIYTIGWIITVEHTFYLSTTPLEAVSFTIKEWLSIAAPALWFAGTIYLTRHQRPVNRLVWLAVGVVVLIPWPFLFGITNVR